MPSGQAVQGLASATGFQFLGIPFAQPPVGTLRFVDAQPVSPIPGVFNATQYGAACPQNCELPPHTCPPLIAEDCLSLNIYTPSLNPSRLLPVMFYIHGGNFKQGYGGGPLYDSSNLANATAVPLAMALVEDQHTHCSAACRPSRYRPMPRPES